MATILVLAHEHDGFHARRFMLQGLFEHWIEAGHFVVVHESTENLPPADIAILHVDLTVVPPEHVEALRRYPVVVNGAATALARRSYSRHIVAPGDGYEGPVIVKTDANCGGLPELHHSEREIERGRPVLTAVRYIKGRYPIFRSPSLVPAHVWTDPQLIVEKFLPELDERGYVLRVYTFFGDRERSTRVVGRHPVVKGQDVIERVSAPLPDEIREWRRRLGLDYGKLDFVIHEGTPVLLDANRTPTLPANLAEIIGAGMKDLALGIDAFLRPG